MMKNKGLIVFLIIIIVTLIFSLTGFMIYAIDGKIKFNTESKLVMDETYSGDYSKINIKSSSMDIYIKKSDNDKARVVIYGEKDSAKVNTLNNILDINIDSKPRITFCFFVCKSNRLELYLPNNYSNDIKIDSRSGDIQIGDFKNNNIEVKSTSGDIEVVSSKNIVIDSTSGDIELGKIANVKIKSKSGDIDIDSATGKLEIDSTSGDIEIDHATITKHSYINSHSGDVDIDNTNYIYTDAKAKAGDVNINKNNRKSDIVLTIRSISGDININ